MQQVWLRMQIKVMPKNYPIPEHSKRKVNEAGRLFVNPHATSDERDAALEIINNWRGAHHFPLNTFQMRLRDNAKRISPNSLVAQRIKRLPSIKLKLELKASMKLSQMQDIAGCRAIVPTLKDVGNLVSKYLHESRGVKHRLVRSDDYIGHPQPSGYRGVHLIYKYKSDKRPTYDDMRIEIQIRSLMQHSWATAVEIVGTFIQQSLKSSQGEADWLRFFALMGSVMAIEEKCPLVPSTPQEFSKLKEEVLYLSDKLDVHGHLTTFKQSIQVIGGIHVSTAHYYLLQLDVSNSEVTIQPYNSNQLQEATEEYMRLEKQVGEKDIVLVAADSIESLKIAYPNYYLDADLFLSQINNLKSSGTLFSGQLRLFD